MKIDTYLTKFPGIGKKTARQIVLDLKGKVKITEEDSDSLLQVDATSTVRSIRARSNVSVRSIRLLLTKLAKVEKTLNKNKYDSVDEAVKAGLQLVVS